jgi:flavin-dependent dehydrogenase
LTASSGTAIDVAVIGGGPAGLAVAGLLARRGRNVVVFDRGRKHAVGETFGGEIHALVDELGVALPEPSVPFTSVRSAWGRAELAERDSITHALGDGVHVDRARFDAALAAWAGVPIEHRTASARELAARYVVDATGRGAQGSSSLGRDWLGFDRAIARFARVTPARDEPGLLVESARDGWWYSAPQPDGTCVVVHVTDHDLVGDEPPPHTAARIGGLPELATVRADSGVAIPARGPGWCTVGDAMFATDPLAGNGVAQALRSAIAAAPAIDAELAGHDLALASPAIAGYLDRRASYYALERRFADALFWQRRHRDDRPITLAPEAVLRATGDARAATLASAEAYLPARAITAVVARVADPEPAHVVLAELRTRVPLPDRWLVMGVQRLVECGALTAS